jgi:hypothetical protein
MNVTSTDAGDQQSSTFRMSVQAGQWSSAALRALPRGGSLSVDVATDGPVEVLLFDDSGYKAFPGLNAPLVQAETADNYGFKLVLPESGDFFLVADNRGSEEARLLVVRITAAAPGSGSMTAEDYRDTANQMLAMVEEGLRKVFLMEDVNLMTQPCGSTRTFADSQDIVVCLEYAMALLLTVEQKEAASPAMMFNIFQRLAEIFLARSDDAEASVENVDELATALMVLLGYREKAEIQARYFTEPENAEALRQRVAADDPRPLSSERAARIERLIADDDLMRRWQHVIVPNFQIESLTKLKNNPPQWLDVQALVEELQRRDRESH